MHDVVETVFFLLFHQKGTEMFSLLCMWTLEEDCLLYVKYTNACLLCTNIQFVCVPAVCWLQCQNGGVCQRPNICSCPEGWMGRLCEDRECLKALKLCVTTQTKISEKRESAQNTVHVKAFKHTDQSHTIKQLRRNPA